ncbi:MAG: competence type IV pilus major pilin ComGC [Candidatus Aquicultorales bacterium]
MFMKLRSERGFTLIELMVVILIIGILVAIAVPVFNAARENAYARTCQANLRTIDGAVQTFRANDASGLWPANIAAIVSANFLKAAPECPKASAGYDYTITAVDQSTTPIVACPNAGDPGYEQHTY